MAASLVVQVTGDPRPFRSLQGPGWLVPVNVQRAERNGLAITGRSRALVFGDQSWSPARLGERWQVRARLAVGEDGTILLDPLDVPHRVAPAGWAWRAADQVRHGIRVAAAPAPVGPRGLLPALVDGDESGLSDTMRADFQVTGLTHLLAVSGTNLTLVVGFLLAAARLLGVRGRWLVAVGLLGVVGFVLLARTEPSVLRAAVMGTVALLGMGHRGRERGLRALGASVVLLLLLDPTLAPRAGFALSVLATAGILLLAPGWRDALATWLPRWLAEVIAIPAAAQLACTPVVAAISGQVSVVAVVANLLAAPVVGPATVLGLVGGLVCCLSPRVGQILAWPATWCVRWVIAVAEQGAALPRPAQQWGTGALALSLLVLVCLALMWWAPRVLSQRWLCVGVALVVVAWMLVPQVRFGWPPSGWILVACDVGQGDALVLRAGPGSAVVVDVGPDPRAMDRCLNDLGVRQVPVALLTHFHADHVAGLSGALSHHIGVVETSAVPNPADGAAQVLRLSRAAGVPVRTAPVGTRQIGELTWQVLDDGSDPVSTDPNDASVLVLATIRGTLILLTGDVGAESERRLWPLLGDTVVDVLKVPHHGSRDQDTRLLTGIGARLALVSVGADNTYGHPAPDLLDALAAAGMQLGRTDRQGDLAVVEGSDGGLTLHTSR